MPNDQTQVFHPHGMPAFQLYGTQQTPIVFGAGWDVRTREDGAQVARWIGVGEPFSRQPPAHGDRAATPDAEPQPAQGTAAA
jgi:hypothetical protein